jgi:hypothetical protein
MADVGKLTPLTAARYCEGRVPSRIENRIENKYEVPSTEAEVRTYYYFSGIYVSDQNVSPMSPSYLAVHPC